MVFAFAGTVLGADAKKEADKDPLAKYSDEDLIKIDFCFEKFCEAIAAKDAKVAAALIDELPKNLAKLDLNKEADRATFLKAFAGFAGAEFTAEAKLGRPGATMLSGETLRRMRFGAAARLPLRCGTMFAALVGV